jgi:hypothetical protein
MENSAVIKKFRLIDLKKIKNLKKLQNIENKKKDDDYNNESVNSNSIKDVIKKYLSLTYSYISSFRLIKLLLSNNKYLKSRYKSNRNKIRNKKNDLEGGNIIDPGVSSLEGFIPEDANQGPQENKDINFVKNDSDEDGDNEYDNEGYESSSSISSQSSLSSDDSDVIIINSPLFPVWLTTLDRKITQMYLKIFFIYIIKNIRDKIILNILNRINSILIYIMMKIDGKKEKIDDTDDISQEIEVEFSDINNQNNHENNNQNIRRINSYINDSYDDDANGNYNGNYNDHYHNDNGIGRSNYNHNNISDDSQENA